MNNITLHPTATTNALSTSQPTSALASKSMRRSDATHAAPALRTPYHSLSDEGDMRIPAWAQHRSVYRSSGRTLYLVETDRLADARRDLARLGRSGWNVQVSEEAAGSRTRIALTRRELAQAA